MKGFTGAERALIQKAATTGIATDALNILGSRLIPMMVAGAELGAGGGMTGGLLAGGAAHVGSSLSRKAAESMQMRPVNKLMKEISERNVSKSIPARNKSNRGIKEFIKDESGSLELNKLIPTKAFINDGRLTMNDINDVMGIQNNPIDKIYFDRLPQHVKSDVIKKLKARGFNTRGIETPSKGSK